MSDSLLARDRAHLWHPYTQHQGEADPLPIASARDAVLTLADGRELIDGISSWWATLHGHGHPLLVEAMANQARTLDHVLFAGATHEPAVALAQELLAVAPPGLTRVFYSDDGSTAVEVALKMAFQRWVHLDQAQRTVFVCLEGGYHGDTIGALSVGDPDPFFLAYAPLAFEVRRVAPEVGAVEAALADLGQRAAGVVLEPLLMGAAGMRMTGEPFLRSVRAACDTAGVPLIADEVLTGFGRTGALFACERAGVAPDLLCLAKGLSGGTFPISATLATDEIWRAFLSNDRARAFFHGHTFTAHPVGCAIARASLRLVRESDVPARLEAIGRTIHAALEPLTRREDVRDLRQLGGVVAFDLVPASPDDAGYLASMGPRLRRAAIEAGVLLRPLGNVVYAIPPACTTEQQGARIADAMTAMADAARETD